MTANMWLWAAIAAGLLAILYGAISTTAILRLPTGNARRQDSLAQFLVWPPTGAAGFMSWPACGSDEGAEVPLAGLSAILSQHGHLSFIFSQHSILGFSAGAAWAWATPGSAIASATATINLFIVLTP